MSNIEITGKSIEEAIKLAVEQLGVTEDDVYVEILDEGSKGFLGIGQAPARVRVVLKDNGSSTIGEEPIMDIENSVNGPITDLQHNMETDTKNTDITEASANEPQMADMSDTARSVLQSIVDGIGFGGKAVITGFDDETVHLTVEGGDSGVIIGKHGQTINSIQYLVSTIINKHQPKRVRVIVDADGYRTRREETLRSRAIHLADEVRQSKQEAVLEPLDASERRIIHTTLADDPDVRTYSEGEEPDRHVVISPRD